MNYKAAFLCILFFELNAVSQNNLIHNESFETNKSSEPNSPCKIAQVENMEVWEDDAQIIAKDIFTNSLCSYRPCVNEDCAKCALIHSPDWFKADNGKSELGSNTHAVIAFTTPPSPASPAGGFGIVKAHTGEGYVGMFPGELIEQKFFGTSPLIGGKRYVFSMYVQIPNQDYFQASETPFSMTKISDVLDGAFLAIPDQNSTFNISVWLGTQKIKYEQQALTCLTVFKHHIDDEPKQLTFNNIVKIKDFVISPINHTINQWHRLTFEFIAPSSHNFDWIAIEHSMAPKSSGDNGYILIDDVSLVESCELSCHPTSGIPSPQISSHSGAYPNLPLRISNLGNVRKLRWEVYPINGGNNIMDQSYEYTNGIPFDIHWNGEIQWGSTAATGNYIAKLTCENDCGTYVYSGNFVNVGATSPFWVSPAHTKIEEKIINPCCLVDHTINNTNLTNSHYFKIRNNIFVNTNDVFKNGSNTSLVAGNEIQFLGEVATESTAELAAYIEECADAHRQLQNGVLTDKDFVFYENTNQHSNFSKTENIVRETRGGFDLFPNPHASSFVIGLVESAGLPYQIIVEDVYGNKVFSIEYPKDFKYEISLNEKADGVYFVKVLYHGSAIVKKAVKTE